MVVVVVVVVVDEERDLRGAAGEVVGFVVRIVAQTYWSDNSCS